MTQPEALRLADEMERVAEYDHQVQAAAELRRLYELNQELLKELYVYRAAEYLKDVTAAYKKIAEGEMSITINDVLTLAMAKGRIVRPSAIDVKHCVVDCGPCTDPNERGRMTDTGFYAVVDGRYVTVGIIDEVYKWLEGLE